VCAFSFCKSQNEDIVRWLLERESSAELIAVDSHGIRVRRGELTHCVRLDHIVSQTSGLFIAKIQKVRVCCECVTLVLTYKNHKKSHESRCGLYAFYKKCVVAWDVGVILVRTQQLHFLFLNNRFRVEFSRGVEIFGSSLYASLTRA